MAKRTTVEIDEDLLTRAKRVLSLRTTRETIEESLRRVVDEGESEEDAWAEKQAAFLSQLPDRIDLHVLRSDEMWR